MTSEPAPGGPRRLRLALLGPVLLLAGAACLGTLELARARGAAVEAAAGVQLRQAAEGLRAELAVLQGALAGYAGMLEGAAPRRAAELAPLVGDLARRAGQFRAVLVLDSTGAPLPSAAARAGATRPGPLAPPPKPGEAATLALVGADVWLLQAVPAEGAAVAWVLAGQLDHARLAAASAARLGIAAPDLAVAIGPAGMAVWPAADEMIRADAGGGSLRALAALPRGPVLAEAAAARRGILLAGGGGTILLLLWALVLQRLLRPAPGGTALPAAPRRGGEPGHGFMAALPVTIYRGELFPDGSYLPAMMSGNLEALTGLTWHALSVPGAWRRRLDADGREALDAFYRRLLEEGEAVADYGFRQPDGSLRWLRDHARIIRLGEHGFAEVAGCLADISVERQLGDQSVASAKLATLGRMATSLAHELSQPLGAILLAAENAVAALPDATDAPLWKATHRRLQRIAEQAERARLVVDHLRAFGRSDAGALEAVPLAAAIEGAMLLAGQPLGLAGVAVTLALADGLPPVRARRILLEQVLMNLMLNARDAMLQRPEEQRLLHFSAVAGPRPQSVTLRVQDTGHGFLPEVLPRLFEPFFTTKPPGQGTGLGLSICHGILQSFGGSIAASNAATGGAVFELVLREAAVPSGAAVQSPGAAEREDVS